MAKGKRIIKKFDPAETQAAALVSYDGNLPDLCWSVKIRGRRSPKINAAQASHLGRIARERRACRFAAPGGEVCARNRIPEGTHVFCTRCRQSIRKYEIRRS
jgi:hypothetical protein